MKFFTHKLSLIERTKLLEGIVCQSLAFTNNLGKQWGKGDIDNKKSALMLFNSNDSDDILFKNIFSKQYQTPVGVGSKISIIPLKSIWENIKLESTGLNNYYIYNAEDITTEINNGGDNLSYKYDESSDLEIKSNMIISYHLEICQDPSFVYEYDAKYFISAVENRYPTKPNTVTYGINRILDLAEPLFEGQAPRFALNPIQAKKWENTPLPDTTLTQCTLREQLQHIGRYVHAEPRLGGRLTSTIEYNGVTYTPGYYENMIFFDEYGGTEVSTVQGKPYVYNQVSQDINNYCTDIDSSAENVVNSLDYGQGVIFAPDKANYKTLRTESVNIRLEDTSTSLIATEFPIYDVVDIKCRLYYKGNGKDNINSSISSLDWTYVEDGDYSYFDVGSIKPFVYEEHEYNSILSSYGGTYPYSKSYAIYYTQGEKNIKGLFFKPTNEESAIFGNYVNQYSIVNIIESVINDGVKDYTTENFAYLSFQISYIPFYQSRFSHGKSYVIGQDRKLPFAKIYNQGENVIETRFYGENIKGVSARMGNKEGKRTYYLSSINAVPKCGTLLDGYKISQVNTEYQPFSIKCTVGLTKKFNRISQNVGINSHKRVYEVSERQAYERNILLKEYICIGDNTNVPLKKSILQQNVLPTIDMFGGIYNIGTDLQTVATVSYLSKAKRELARVKAPIISSAFGNTVVYSFGMKDNYSAGEQVAFLDDEFWQTDVPCSDYYGKAYYCNFQLLGNIAPTGTLEEALTSATEQGAIGGRIGTLWDVNELEGTPYVLRKDSREALSFNITFEYITDRQDLIIGSACAQFNTTVSNSKLYEELEEIKREKPIVYFFSEPISQFETSIIGKTVVAQRGGVYFAVDRTTGEMSFDIPDLARGFASWAIAYPTSSKTSTVYDEDSDSDIEYTEITGGEILIACNNDSTYYTDNGITSEKLTVRAYSDKYKEYED